MSLYWGGSCGDKDFTSLRTIVKFERIYDHIGSETKAKIFIKIIQQWGILVNDRKIEPTI